MLVADISSYQGPNPGAALKSAGFAAVIDQPLGNVNYAGQIAGCQAAGLAILAAYAFAAPGDGAALCDRLVGAMVGPEQRLVIDCEVAGITPAECLAFGQRAVQWRSPARPILYASTSYVRENYGGTPALAQLFDLWLAEYHNDLSPTNLPAAPAPWSSWIGWQYSDAYPVPGVGGVDASIFNAAPSNPMGDFDVSEIDDKVGPWLKDTEGRIEKYVHDLLGQWLQEMEARIINALKPKA